MQTHSTRPVQFTPRTKGQEFQQMQPPNVGDTDLIFVTFGVKDSGQGLTETDIMSLFQRFKEAPGRTHIKYASGGSGLSLLIKAGVAGPQG